MGITKLLTLNDKGFTTIEILVSSLVIAILSISLFSAFVSLNSTAIFSKRKMIGTELATNQLEYLKSLPYDDLAVVGGAIPHSSPLPNSKTVTIDSTNYEITTAINYIDDAFDGCASYATPELKNQICRNLPEPGGSPVDTNPADYKIVDVKAYVLGKKVAELDTSIAARVAETDSNTGSLTVTVIDSSGNPVSGANVNVVNTNLNPDININDSTDINGVAIFYGLPPDSSGSYVATASKSDYSSLTTISPAGSLAPNFPSQNIIVQQSSSVTLTIDPMGQYSVLAEVVDTSSNPLSGARIYTKGGQKKYSSSSDTSYYFDNFSPTDTRPTSDTNGNFVLENLTPSGYIFCGDTGSTNCAIGGTTYYLTAAIPYTGSSQFGPVQIPPYIAASPPSTTFPFSGHNYYQKARLILTTNSNFPRITTVTNGTALKSTGTHSFTIKGVNLPCDASNSALCGTTVTVKNSGGNMIASCTGADSELQCNISLASANIEQSNFTISANGYTLDIPNGTGLLGGINVSP